MPRPAPAIDRAVELLEYMSSHRLETFKLSELARTLHFNKATCHAMCTTLEKHGVLIRNPIEKTYSLGPALLRFAAAVAPEGHEALEVSRTEMAALAAELSLTVVATGLVGDVTTVLANRSPRGHRGHPSVGSQRAWLPPIGPTFAAWAPIDVQRKWLDRIEQPNVAFTKSYFEDTLKELRARGYDVGYVSDPRTQILKAASTLEGLPNSREISEMLADLMAKLESTHQPSSRGETKKVNNITAPVFGSGGQVVLTVTLREFKEPLSSDDVKRLGIRLLKSVERVTQSTHGDLPEDWPHS